MEKKKFNNKERMFNKLSAALVKIADAISGIGKCPIRHHHTFDPIEVKLSEPVPAVPRVRFDFAVGLAQNKTKGNSMLELTITNEQKIPVTLKPVTATGKPAKLDPNNPPTWEVISGNATVSPAADGLSAELVSGDDPGDSEILVKADADIGEGVVEVSDVIRLSVAGAQAANLGLAAGAAEPK